MSKKNLGEQLLKDLGFSQKEISNSEFNSEDKEHFSNILKEDSKVLNNIGYEFSIFLGLSNRWKESLEVIEFLIRSEKLFNVQLKLWQLRCLVELGRFAEAVVLIDSSVWPKDELIHVNYFAGLSFDGLKLKDQARQRFLAVLQADATYKNVEQILHNI